MPKRTQKKKKPGLRKRIATHTRKSNVKSKKSFKKSISETAKRKKQQRLLNKRKKKRAKQSKEFKKIKTRIINRDDSELPKRRREIHKSFDKGKINKIQKEKLVHLSR